MIFTDRIITVRKGESKINEPIIVYRGDYELEVRFTIMNSKFKFMSGTNLIESENAAYGQLAILTPYGGNIFSEIAKCNDGTVTFVLTKSMLDQIEEVGLYSFQIRLFDYNKDSRVSIPPVEFGIEVREPITSEDHDNSVNNAIVGYSIAKIADALNEKVPDTFNGNGDYNKTIWETGDRITEGKLNKIEDAIDKINQNEKDDVAALDKRVTSNFSVLDSTKADKNEIFSMKNMGQDVKEAMTGGSVAVVGKDAILTENIVDNQITNNKLDLPVKELLPQTFIFKLIAVSSSTGELEPNSVNGRATTEQIIAMKAGTKLYLRDKENTHYALAYYNADGSFKKYVTFAANDMTFESDEHVRIMQKYSDSYGHTIDDLEYFANNMYVITEDTTMSKKEIRDMFDSMSEPIKNNTTCANSIIGTDIMNNLTDENILEKNENMIHVNAGSFYTNYLARRDIPGVYYALVTTNDMVGIHGIEGINLSFYDTSLGPKYDSTIYLGNGEYFTKFEVSDLADVNAYGEFRLLISMRESSEPIDIYSRTIWFVEQAPVDKKISAVNESIKQTTKVSNNVVAASILNELTDDNILLSNESEIAVPAGEYHSVTISTQKAGIYYALVTTDDVVGAFSADNNIAISAYSEKLGVKHDSTIYLGNGDYLCKFELNDINDIADYGQFRLLISMRSSTLSVVVRKYVIWRIDKNHLSNKINTLASIVSPVVSQISIVYDKSDSIEIPANDYHKYIIAKTTKGTCYALVSTDDMTGSRLQHVNLSGYNSEYGSVKGKTMFIGNGKYVCVYDCANNHEFDSYNSYEFRLLIDNRTYTTPMTVYNYSIHNDSISTAVSSSGLTLYVSPSGSDDRSGTSFGTALKTFQKAIDLGATRIFAEPGTYWGQTLVADNRESLEIKVVSKTINYTMGQKAKAIIHNGNGIGMTFDDTLNLYTYDIQFDPSHNYHKVFITKELDVEATWRQSISYNAILWEIDTTNFRKDVKLVPVLTLDECKSKVGSFHYDGNRLYVNPNNKNNDVYRYPITSDNSIDGVRISNVKRLCLEDIEVAYASKEGFQLTNINEARITSCIAHHTSYGSCFNVDNVNGNFYNCTGYKSRVDGFGIVGGGNTNFYDCFGYYNYDDGISHHDYCTGIVDGGEWHHNGKGGISPAHGAQVDVKNVFSHDNAYGIYSASSDDRPKGFTVRHINNVCYDNKYGIGVSNYHVISYNCNYENNQTPVYIVKENEYTSHTIL